MCLHAVHNCIFSLYSFFIIKSNICTQLINDDLVVRTLLFKQIYWLNRYNGLIFLNLLFSVFHCKFNIKKILFQKKAIYVQPCSTPGLFLLRKEQFNVFIHTNMFNEHISSTLSSNFIRAILIKSLN